MGNEMGNNNTSALQVEDDASMEAEENEAQTRLVALKTEDKDSLGPVPNNKTTEQEMERPNPPNQTPKSEKEDLEKTDTEIELFVTSNPFDGQLVQQTSTNKENDETRNSTSLEIKESNDRNSEEAREISSPNNLDPESISSQNNLYLENISEESITNCHESQEQLKISTPNDHEQLKMSKSYAQDTCLNGSKFELIDQDEIQNILAEKIPETQDFVVGIEIEPHSEVFKSQDKDLAFSEEYIPKKNNTLFEDKEKVSPEEDNLKLQCDKSRGAKTSDFSESRTESSINSNAGGEFEDGKKEDRFLARQETILARQETILAEQQTILAEQQTILETDHQVDVPNDHDKIEKRKENRNTLQEETSLVLSNAGDEITVESLKNEKAEGDEEKTEVEVSLGLRKESSCEFDSDPNNTKGEILELEMEFESARVSKSQIFNPNNSKEICSELEIESESVQIVKNQDYNPISLQVEFSKQEIELENAELLKICNFNPNDSKEETLEAKTELEIPQLLKDGNFNQNNSKKENSKLQMELESTERLSSESESYSDNLNNTTQMRKSPSFDLDLKFEARNEESEKTQLLSSANQVEVSLQNPFDQTDCGQLSLPVEEKVVKIEKGSSKKSKNQITSKSQKEENQLVLKNGVKGLDDLYTKKGHENEKKKSRVSFLATCICCAAMIN